jgi:hypothetical protein
MGAERARRGRNDAQEAVVPRFAAPPSLSPSLPPGVPPPTPHPPARPLPTPTPPRRSALLLQDYVSSVLLPHGLVLDRVEKVAADIRGDYPDSTPHLLVVLKGGSEFAVDLTRTLRRLHASASGAPTHLPFTVD